MTLLLPFSQKRKEKFNILRSTGWWKYHQKLSDTCLAKFPEGANFIRQLYGSQSHCGFFFSNYLLVSYGGQCHCDQIFTMRLALLATHLTNKVLKGYEEHIIKEEACDCSIVFAWIYLRTMIGTWVSKG